MIHILFTTFDSVHRGVGQTQVAELCRKLAARGIRVTVLSFEYPDAESDAEFAYNGNPSWISLRFGPKGVVGGIYRLAWLAIRSRLVRRVDVIHCRGDLAFLASAGRRKPRLWDMRAFWPQQRVVTGALSEKSIVTGLMLRVQRYCYRKASAINTLSREARDCLTELYGPSQTRSVVIPTSVNIERFGSPVTAGQPPLRVVFLGSGNAFYDFPSMSILINQLRSMAPTQSFMVSEIPPNEEQDAFDAVVRLEPSEVPEFVGSCHVGLAMCRDDAGVSLSGVAPTKVGEYLAAGIPVVVNSRLPMPTEAVGEVPWFIRVGRRDLQENSAASRVLDLVQSEGLRDVCRRAAIDHYSLTRAVDQWIHLYSFLHQEGKGDLA